MVSGEPVAITTDYTFPHEFVDRQIRASVAAFPALKALTEVDLDALIASVRDDLRETIQAIVARGVRQ